MWIGFENKVCKRKNWINFNQKKQELLLLNNNYKTDLLYNLLLCLINYHLLTLLLPPITFSHHFCIITSFLQYLSRFCRFLTCYQRISVWLYYLFNRFHCFLPDFTIFKLIPSFWFWISNVFNSVSMFLSRSYYF